MALRKDNQFEKMATFIGKEIIIEMSANRNCIKAHVVHIIILCCTTKIRQNINFKKQMYFADGSLLLLSFDA